MDQSAASEVAKKALEFRQRYYSMLDDPEKRPSLVSVYAADVPNLCEWNGHQLENAQAVQNYLQTLPKTMHQIDAMDAQPLPGDERADSFIMTVHGIVTYDDEHKREFYQRFVLRRADNRGYFIVNDYYRWLAER